MQPHIAIQFMINQHLPEGSKVTVQPASEGKPWLDFEVWKDGKFIAAEHINNWKDEPMSRIASMCERLAEVCK